MESEAHELTGIYALATPLPELERTRTQELVRTYVRVVVEEWPRMERGQTSPRADSLVRRLRSEILGFDPRTEDEQVLYESELAQFHDGADARRSRLLEAREGIPGLPWTVLVLGGAITVSFTYLFGLKSNLAHALMVAALTVVICGILFTIGEFNNPFSGLVEIRPEAFKEVLVSYGEPYISTAPMHDRGHELLSKPTDDTSEKPSGAKFAEPPSTPHQVVMYPLGY